jgi:hypothetical protein
MNANGAQSADLPEIVKWGGKQAMRGVKSLAKSRKGCKGFEYESE